MVSCHENSIEKTLTVYRRRSGLYLAESQRSTCPQRRFCWNCRYPLTYFPIREQQDDPTSSTRFFATSRLKDTLEQVVDTAAKRWTVETFFADFKERMGSDQYQLHSAEAIQRFWALVHGGISTSMVSV